MVSSIKSKEFPDQSAIVVAQAPSEKRMAIKILITTAIGVSILTALAGVAIHQHLAKNDHERFENLLKEKLLLEEKLQDTGNKTFSFPTFISGILAGVVPLVCVGKYHAHRKYII